jgi:hypothetical protein
MHVARTQIQHFSLAEKREETKLDFRKTEIVEICREDFRKECMRQRPQHSCTGVPGACF